MHSNAEHYRNDCAFKSHRETFGDRWHPNLNDYKSILQVSLWGSCGVFNSSSWRNFYFVKDKHDSHRLFHAFEKTNVNCQYQNFMDSSSKAPKLWSANCAIRIQDILFTCCVFVLSENYLELSKFPKIELCGAWHTIFFFSCEFCCIYINFL